MTMIKGKRIICRRKGCALGILSAVGILMSCVPRPETTVLEGFALGTTYSITIVGDVPADIRMRVDSVFAEADASMSVFNPESLLSRINRNETDSVDAHITYCIELARKVSELSSGKYDVTVQPLVEAFGFSGKPQQEMDIDSLLALVGYEKIAVEQGRLIKRVPGMQIGLNSVAKGYTVDMLAGLLDREGVADYLVDVGGEIFCRGANGRGKDWVVGIDTPFEGNYVPGAYMQGTISVSGVGVATSGNYRNFHTDSLGRKFTHIIDPTTGANTASDLLSATVVAANCALADAYGTMLIAVGFDGARELLGKHDIAALLIYADERGEMHPFMSEAMKRYAGPGMKGEE